MKTENVRKSIEKNETTVIPESSLSNECPSLGIYFEKCVKILSVRQDDKDKKACRLVFCEADGSEMEALVGVEKEYFTPFIEKTVYISGAEFPYSKDIKKWLLSSCHDVTFQEMAKAVGLTGEDRDGFEKCAKGLTPEMLKDLLAKGLRAAGFPPTDDDRASVVYSTTDELKAAYLVMKKAMPPAIRSLIQRCLDADIRNYSLQEKRNCLKIVEELLELDWTDDRKWKADVSVIRDKLNKAHIGHDASVEKIVAELSACNVTGMQPKTINLVGMDDDESLSMAIAIAEGLNRRYEVVDFGGKDLSEIEQITGTTRIYENAHVGELFENIQKVGLSGILIFRRIDQYSSNILQVIEPFLKQTMYEDVFIGEAIHTPYVICTCNFVEDLPMSIRTATNEIVISDPDECELRDIINDKFLPKWCDEYGLKYGKNEYVKSDVAHYLIYQMAHLNVSRLEEIIRLIATNALSKSRKYFPRLTLENVCDYYVNPGESESLKTTFVTSLAEMENKFFMLYDRYPETVQKVVVERLNRIRYEKNRNRKEYYLDTLRYFVNVYYEDIPPVDPAEILEKVNETHYKESELVMRLIDLIRADEMAVNTGGMIVIGLHGPAGVGKTSTIKRVAGALNRQFLEISIAGVNDSSYIRGVRPSYKDPTPSAIMSRAASSGHGSYKSIVFFDELDKVQSNGFDPLYEFLDPTKESYYDDYLEALLPKNGFVVFLTFNDKSKIPGPILDRMHIIECEGYSLMDKEQIVKRYVMKAIENKYGFAQEGIALTEEACKTYVKNYAVNLGVRDAEKDMESVMLYKLRGKTRIRGQRVMIEVEDIRAALGGSRTRGLDDILEKSRMKPGQARALAVAGDYGVTFLVETVENKFQDVPVRITGLPEGSCLESVTVAQAVVSNYLKKELPKLHIHMTNPGIAKDGPSAGMCIFFSIMSHMLDIPLPNCAFTGSIDLFGNVGVIGGIKAKLCAAERAGVGTVYVPRDNYDMLVEKDEIASFTCQIVPVDDVYELIPVLFGTRKDQTSRTR